MIEEDDSVYIVWQISVIAALKLMSVSQNRNISSFMNIIALYVLRSTVSFLPYIYYLSPYLPDERNVGIHMRMCIQVSSHI